MQQPTHPLGKPVPAPQLRRSTRRKAAAAVMARVSDAMHQELRATVLLRTIDSQWLEAINQPSPEDINQQEPVAIHQPESSAIQQQESDAIDSPSSGLVGPASFRLLALPAELRVMIYSEVFGSTHVLLDAKLRVPGLLLASKQLRSEALKLYYRLSIFHLAAYHGPRRLGALPNAHFALITHIRHHGCEHLIPLIADGSIDEEVYWFWAANIIKSFPIVFQGKNYADGKLIKAGVLTVELERTTRQIRAAAEKGELVA